MVEQGHTLGGRLRQVQQILRLCRLLRTWGKSKKRRLSSDILDLLGIFANLYSSYLRSLT